jgi:D-alanyl-D-alanine carboxypeptidase
MKKSIKKRKRQKKLLILIFCLIIALIIFMSINILKKKSQKEKLENIENQTIITTKNETTETPTEQTSTTSTTKASTTTTKTISKASQTTSTKNNESSSYEYIGTTSKGYKIEYKNGAYYVDNYLIVNKSYSLSKDWVPQNTYKTITDSMDGFCRECIDKEAYEAWSKMKSDAAALGLNIWIQSGYRSYSYQTNLYNGYVKRKGQEAADKSSARPGSSEHQSGLSFDLNTITNSFKDTDEGKWVNANCYLYGYIIRFPEGKDSETGYTYEPWHIRYVGKELAKILYNDGDWLTMEDYFGIDSKYKD